MAGGMTRRDLAWRSAGFVMTAGSCAATFLSLEGGRGVLALCVTAILGIVLMIHGKKVGQAFRAERRGHYHTADAVHAARIRRRGQNTDGFGH